MSTYNITEWTGWKDTTSYRVDVVDLDKTRSIGSFDTREEAEKRIEEHKLIRGTEQSTWLRVKSENLPGYIQFLIDESITHSVVDNGIDAVIEVIAINEDQFNRFLESFR